MVNNTTTTDNSGPTVGDIFDGMTSDQQDLVAILTAADNESFSDQELNDMYSIYETLTPDELSVAQFMIGSSDNVKHSVESLTEDILHYGIAGMHWGIRNSESLSRGPASPHTAPTLSGRTLGKGQGVNSKGQTTRDIAKIAVKSGHASLGQAHMVALKSKGHRIANAFLGDKTYWKRAGIILGSTVAGAGLIALAPASIPAAVITGAITTLGVASRAASVANVASNYGRAIRGNSRIDKNFESIRLRARENSKFANEKTRKILTRNGSISRKLLELPSAKHLDIFDLESTLAHYGVQGMHWGIRNGTTTGIDGRQISYTTKEQAKAHNAITDSLHTAIDKATHETQVETILNKAHKDGHVEGNVKIEGATDSQDGKTIQYDLKFYRQKAGKTNESLSTGLKVDYVSKTVVRDLNRPLGHSDISDLDDALAHYGIKGMHWGFRRAVGPDGLITGNPASAKRNPQASVAGGNGSKKENKAIAKVARKTGQSEDHIRTQINLKKNVSTLSTEEIKNLTKRIKAVSEFSTESAKLKEQNKPAIKRLANRLLRPAKAGVNKEVDKIISDFTGGQVRKGFTSFQKAQQDAKDAKAARAHPNYFQPAGPSNTYTTQNRDAAVNDLLKALNTGKGG